jgi:hypothetical protein
MRGHNLREVLTDIRNAIGASGGSKHAEAVASVEAVVARHDTVEIDELIARSDTGVAALTMPAWQVQLNRVKAAGLSEGEFLSVFDALKSDKSIKKADLFKVAEGYVGFVDKTRATERLLDAIKTRFYGKLYDEDASAMAMRATPR